MIAIDLPKQEPLDPDSKATKQINFTGNLERQATIIFIIDEAKETAFFTRNCKSIVILFFPLIENDSM